MRAPKCCFIPCDKPAEFDIQGHAGLEDGVQACEAHVGALLGTPASWKGEQNRHWDVEVIAAPASENLGPNDPARDEVPEYVEQAIRDLATEIEGETLRQPNSVDEKRTALNTSILRYGQECRESANRSNA